MTVSETIFKWLEDNKDFIKVQAICERLNIDKGNFSKYRSSKSIPEKYLIPIIELIKPFGFKEEGSFVTNKIFTKENYKKLPPFLKKETESTSNHLLWNDGDPKENTNAFYLRYGEMTYDEIENKK